MNPSERIREYMSELRNDYMVSRLGIFGSFARGEETEYSDIDILVEFSESVDLFHFIRLQYYLAELFGRKIDMVTPDALKPMIKEQIIGEVQYV